MVFEALHRLGSKADRVLFYPEEWDLIVESDTDRVSQLLLEAKLKYDVVLIPLKIEGIRDASGALELGLRTLTHWSPGTDIH
jgi:hypothetical protein